jgi:TolA-binding protein
VSAEIKVSPLRRALERRTRRLSALRLSLTLVAAIALVGCAVPGDNQQAQNQEDLRGIVASDRQQINALQDQVNRLNDQIAEMQHNGDAGDSSDADKTKVADLEREVQQLKAGGATPAAGMTGADALPGSVPGTPLASGPGGVPGNGMPSTSTARAGGPGNVAGVGGAVEASPGTAPTDNSGATGAANNPTNADSGDSGDADDDNSSDSDDNGTQVAANAPSASAVPPPPAAPGPPLVAGSPSWRALLGQEQGAALSSNDPAAKVYRAGLSAMKVGKYVQAIGVFQGLQRRYPKSSFSEPAEYFAANALYELGKYDQAILQFNDLVMRFPRGRFTSASLLSEAQAFMKMGDRIDARLTLQKLLGDHPSAPEAPTARAMMNSLANG